jgi:hypothetical protein
LIVTLVLLLLAGLVAGTGYWIKHKQSEIRQTRDQRAARIQQINARLMAQEPGLEILDKELDSHCGRVVYQVEYRDAEGTRHKRYFDIESGLPMEQAWLQSCLKLPPAAQ